MALDNLMPVRGVDDEGKDLGVAWLRKHVLYMVKNEIEVVCQQSGSWEGLCERHRVERELKEALGLEVDAALLEELNDVVRTTRR